MSGQGVVLAIPYDRLRVGDRVLVSAGSTELATVTTAEYSPVEGCVAYHVEFNGISIRTPGWGPPSHYRGGRHAYTHDAAFAREANARPTLLDVAYGKAAA